MSRHDQCYYFFTFGIQVASIHAKITNYYAKMGDYVKLKILDPIVSAKKDMEEKLVSFQPEVQKIRQEMLQVIAVACNIYT